ncbi:2-hydroxyacid dehydrogenase [Pontivivens insulae]|uniref:Glycerate dehydrogenase n=1 Tax=Pontivivens insulae TaxID=1639689 RepID=A0A2R8AED0_9RHOB|nr:D-glycerate dehydrogenase [Pontivivens insulae]RED11854.1 lactate dehydrogenase-like 2-hydroxyacid dehydrogenase [Pontivivens insulae]SPF30611.1 Glycerate dehydrogenase [Pontivivens insulae]
MKILVTRRLPETVMRRAHALGATIHDSDVPLTSDARSEALQTYDAILCTLGDRFSSDMFAEPTRCKIIANFGVGYDHIDAAAARAAGVEVTNTPGVLTDATADLAMTLMLMVLRRASEGERLARSGDWTGWTPTQMLGRGVTGATLGIAGMGRIGQAMARKAHFGFGMKICYTARGDKALDFLADRVDLQTLAETADVLAVHAPGGAATRHMINRDVFEAMKPTGILINTARGDVVDQKQLIAALQSGAIAAAGLDVYEGEPDIPAELRALENVTLLPHLGSATLEVREAMGNMALDNIEAFLNGRQVPNPV